MNIINKFAENLGMPGVSFEYLLNVSLCLCSRKPVTDSRVQSVGFHCMVWSKKFIRMKSDRVF